MTIPSIGFGVPLRMVMTAAMSPTLSGAENSQQVPADWGTGSDRAGPVRIGPSATVFRTSDGLQHPRHFYRKARVGAGGRNDERRDPPREARGSAGAGGIAGVRRRTSGVAWTSTAGANRRVVSAGRRMRARRVSTAAKITDVITKARLEPGLHVGGMTMGAQPIRPYA